MKATIQNLAHYMAEQESERLVLKTLTVETMSPDYLQWLKDPNVVRYLEIRHSPQTQETIRKFVNDMLVSEDNLLMGIYLKAPKKHIGNIKLGPVNRIYRRADIGIMIGDKDCWGKGYGQEAIQCLSRMAFSILSLQRLQAGAYASNRGSVKAFLKAGFEQEGLLREYWMLDGKPEDNVILGKLLEA